MEFLAGFLVGWVGWSVLVVASIVALFVEHKECHGWTALFCVLTGIVAKFLFEVPLEMVGYGIVMYIPIGFMWSFWRWKRRCLKLVAAYSPEYEGNSKDLSRRHLTSFQQKLKFKDNISVIVYWIIGWPFSLLESLIGDVIDSIERIIRLIAKNTYERMSDSAMDEMEAKYKEAEQFDDRSLNEKWK